MTDTDRIRRDARIQLRRDQLRDILNRLHGEGGHAWIERAAERLTVITDALLADLERAVKRADDAERAEGQAWAEWNEMDREKADWRRRCEAELDKVAALDARLTKVDKLVEALRYIGDESHPFTLTADGMRKRARAALADWDSDAHEMVDGPLGHLEAP